MDKLLGGAGFTMCLLGCAGMDSENLFIPVGLLAVGAGFLWLYGYISGEFEQKNSPHELGGNEDY